MTTLTARNVMTGAAMLQLIAEHAGLAPRDFSTGAWLDKLDPALDITARDIVTGAYVDKLAGTEPTPSGLMLVPTGALQSVDGTFQRFAYNGAHVLSVDLMELGVQNIPCWYADLPVGLRKSLFSVSLEMPDLTGNKFANVFIAERDAQAVMHDVFTGYMLNLNYIGLELRQAEGSTSLILNIATDQENSTSFGLSNVQIGEVIGIDFYGSSVVIRHAGTSQTFPVPTGFFTQPPNVVAYSSGQTANDIAALSIKVTEGNT